MLQGDTAAALAATNVPAGQIDGPALMAMDLDARPGARRPCCAIRSRSIVRALVGLKALPIATRIEIAERGEALAIIEATRLGDLYLEAVRDGAALPPAIARRARMVAAARNASNPTEMVNSIAAAYGEARGSPLFPTIARASAAALLNLPAQPQYANVAQEAMRGFLLLGDKQQAQAWVRLALKAVSNNARAIIALDRLMPLVAIAGIDDAKRLTIGEINRWYEVTREDDAARAPLRGYLLLELLRATGFDLPPRSTDLPEAPPGNARLVDAADGQPAGAGQCRGRRPARRDGVARADRGRRDAAHRTSSCRRRDDRAGPAPGRRGPCGAPVRDRDAIAYGL